MIFEFDTCILDTAKQQLWRDGEVVHAEPQVLAVLEYLVSNRDRVVTKIELLDEVWADRFVSESALSSRIKLARKACGDNGREQRILRTVHSRGFRFVATVVVSDRNVRTDPPSALAGRHEPSRSPLPAVRPSGGTRRSSTTLFGRSDELIRLDAALVDTALGHRRSVFVRGGVGTGKSTLVAEFLERQDNLDDWLVARGQCIQTRSSVEPYFCLFDALSQLALSVPHLVRDTLERVAPSWLAQMPSLIDSEMAERLERRRLGSTAQRMLREGADAFEALARQRPLLLLLENLQWADDCTLDVVDMLLQRADPVPLLLLGTARPDHDRLGGVIAPALTSGRATVLDLCPLDPEAIAALVSDRLDGADVPAELVAIVARRCDGVPLFAEEIVSTWLRQGDITLTNQVVELMGSLDGLEATVPTTLPPLIERELTGLDPDTLGVLEVCSVAGETFDAASVAAGLDRAVADTEAVLRSIARHRGLIGATGASAWPDGTISAEYRFTHGLYRQVVHDRIPVGHRAQLHERIGLRLQAAYGARATEIAATLAGHFIGAGDTLRAVEQLRAAGEQAAARNAHAHAVGLLLDALDRLATVRPGPERDRAELQVRMSLGPALVATRGWFDESVPANYARALELCDGQDHRSEASARYGLATVSELQGQFERTEALLSPLLDADSEGHLAMEAHELVACSTFHQGAFDRSLHNARMVLDSWDEEAYSALMASIAEHPASSCNSWSSLASWALGRSDDSLCQAARAVELGERNLYALSTAVQQRAMLHQIRNEPQECIEWSDRCRRVGEDQDFPMRVIQADIYKGWALAVSGSADEGTRLIADGLARFRAGGATLNEPYYLGLYADARLHDQEPAHALELLDQALERMRSTTRTYFFESELHRLRARCLLDLGGPDAIERSRAALTESQAIAERQSSPAFALRTLADRLALETAHGDPRPWKKALAALVTTYDDQQPTRDLVRARELLAA